MNVRKFFAPSSREALRLVREALGADAVVLSNRVVDGGVELVALTEATLTDWVDDKRPTSTDAASSGAATPFHPDLAPGGNGANRDRTLAAPGVLAARRVGDDGASALAYVHRSAHATPGAPLSQTAQQAPRFAPDLASRFAPDSASHSAPTPAPLAPLPAANMTPAAPAASRVAPYNGMALYTDNDGQSDSTAFDDTDFRAEAHADVDNDADRDDVVWTRSSHRSAIAATPVSSGAPVSNAANVSNAVSNISSASADVDQPALSTPAAPTPTPMLERPRSLFARVFSRSSRDRSAGSAGSLTESSVPGLRRPEKGDDEARVLGLQRAERGESNANAREALTPTQASARGLGAASSIVVRPAAMPDTPLSMRNTPLPTAPDSVNSGAPGVAAVSAPEVPEAAPMVEPVPRAEQPEPVTVLAAPIEAEAEAKVEAKAEVKVEADTEAPAPVPMQALPSASSISAPGFAPTMYVSKTRVKAGTSVQTLVDGLPFTSIAPAKPAPTATVANTASAPVAAPLITVAPAVEPARSDDGFVDMFAPTKPAAQAAPAAAPVSAPASKPADGPREVAGQVLTQMRDLCGTLGEQLEALGNQERERWDPTRLTLTRMMLACGFSSQLVRLLFEKMPSVANADEGMAWIKATFERNLPVLDNEDALMEQGGVFALMGPTGVGKTTTTAKLAARAVMRHGADRVALLTTDSYRIGAHEQLRIYGRILGVAVHAVKDAADLGLVLSELRNKHMVLIDTIGMSQRDRAVSEQVSMLHGSHLPVKRLLLLNATSHGDTLNEVVKAYGAGGSHDITHDGTNNGLSGCIITKVDESNGIGTALDTVMRHRLPVHYVSNGQKVPEDLRVARRNYLIDEAFSGAHRDSPFLPETEALSALFGTQSSNTGHYANHSDHSNNAHGTHNDNHTSHTNQAHLGDQADAGAYGADLSGGSAMPVNSPSNEVYFG